MSESQSEPQSEGYGYLINYDFVTLNLDAKTVFRNAVLVTAAVVLTKAAIDVSGHQLKTLLVRLVRKSKMRAIDKAHEIVDTEGREQEENQKGGKP